MVSKEWKITYKSADTEVFTVFMLLFGSRSTLMALDKGEIT